jgi:drug/metabolite transporter (DMT)-like permease
MISHWHRIKSLILLIAPFFLWGTSMVAMKEVMGDSSPLFMAGFRLLPAGIVILLVTIWQKRTQPSSLKAWLWITLFALIDGTLFQGFLAEGLDKTGAGIGSVIIDSQPLAVALLSSWLFGELIGIWGGLGLGIGILGISLIGLPEEWIDLLWVGQLPIITPTWQVFLHSGESLMLMASFSMAVGTILIRYVARYVDPVVATGWHMIIGGLPLLFLSAQWESGQWINITIQGWFCLIYSTIFGSAIAYGLFFYLASKDNLTSLSSLTFLTPVFALSFGNFFLAESLNPLQWMGVCLTIVSIFLINQRENIAKQILILYNVLTKIFAIESK